MRSFAVIVTTYRSILGGCNLNFFFGGHNLVPVCSLLIKFGQNNLESLAFECTQIKP